MLHNVTYLGYKTDALQYLSFINHDIHEMKITKIYHKLSTNQFNRLLYTNTKAR